MLARFAFYPALYKKKEQVTQHIANIQTHARSLSFARNARSSAIGIDTNRGTSRDKGVELRGIVIETFVIVRKGSVNRPIDCLGQLKGKELADITFHRTIKQTERKKMREKTKLNKCNND